MSNLKALLAQRAALEQQIETVTREERASAVAKVKALMAEYGLSISDLGTRSSPKSAAPKSFVGCYRA